MKRISFKKFIAGLLSGISMPAFLLIGFVPVFAQANGGKVDVVYAVKDPRVALTGYGLSDSIFLFGGNGLLFTYRASVSAADFSRMQTDPRLEYAEHDAAIAAAAVKVNDPYFTLNDKPEDRQWYLDKINLPEAWEFETGSNKIKVAVVDTGIHASHLELNDGRILDGYDFTTDSEIDADSNSDDNGHGTAVAGVIGAISNNKRGIAGINWKVGIMPVKVLLANGSGTISTVAAGIVWAADHGADIINLSLGGPGFGLDQTLNNAIVHAYNEGAVVISAAGNDLAEHGINLDSSPVYPICADGQKNMIIGVTATDINDQKADFANYGVNCVDISAPGKRILTTAFLPTDPSDNVLIYGSGTSLATPIVSGVAALLKATDPTLTNDRIRDIILGTTDNIDALNQNTCLNSSCNGYLGSGRLNALSALSPQPLVEGILVQEENSRAVYLITGGKKRFVSEFVFRQRGYSFGQVLEETDDQLSDYSKADPLPPLTGTLLKAENDPTVYYIDQEVKRPVTSLVFRLRNFSFANVQEMRESEIDDFRTGQWYWPPDGVMLMAKNESTVYVMEDGVKRAVTGFVFNQRRLSFAKVLTITTNELGHIPTAPDPYWLPPLDGTLVKSNANETVYVTQDGARRPLSGQAFASRYRFSDIKILPQAEIETISPGLPVFN